MSLEAVQANFSIAVARLWQYDGDECALKRSIDSMLVEATYKVERQLQILGGNLKDSPC